MLDTVILVNLIKNEEYPRLVLPFIKSEYFQDDEHRYTFTKIKEYIEDFAIISSIAYSYVLTARVSKLNGLKINVIGSSLIMSTKHKINAMYIALMFIGR